MINRAVITISALLIAPSLCSAQVIYPDLELVRENPTGGNDDGYGIRTRIDGNLALLPAWGEAGIPGLFRGGAAYLFDLRTGEQLRRFISSDLSSVDHFGNSVGLRAELAVFGAYSDSPVAFASGSAYVFNLDSGQQIQKLFPANGRREDYFGSSVAINDSLIAIGAPAWYGQATGIGSVYVYEAETRNLISRLFGDGESQFGSRVELVRDTLYVQSSSALYAFDASSLKLSEMTEFSDLSGGRSPSAYGPNHLAIVQFGDPDAGIPRRVEIRTYSGALVQIISDPSGSTMPEFGRSVALSDTLVAIADTRFQGSVSVHEIQTGRKVATLLRPFDPSDAPGLGWSVSMSDEFIVASTNDRVGTQAYSWAIASLPCTPADLAEPFRVVDLADLTTFVEGFVDQLEISDLDQNQLWDLADVNYFVMSFMAGCS